MNNWTDPGFLSGIATIIITFIVFIVALWMLRKEASKKYTELWKLFTKKQKEKVKEEKQNEQ